MTKAKSDRSKKNIIQIQQSLIRWYKKQGRDLPWRKTRDPYKIWVSEIMLQQTQVETVIPYYKRFLKTFPTPHLLSKAPLENVLKIWQGLGYYSRARNLHRGAKHVVKEWKGVLPVQEKDLLLIPGIGRSTAGALLSLAFDIPTPILDGNVKRVLCRLYAIQDDMKTSHVQKRLWVLSQELTPSKDVHSYTQAIMDLGATVCTPRVPNCALCPLKKYCSAFRKNLQNQIPVRTGKKAIPHRHFALGLIKNRGRLLIMRRPEKGLLGGLWGFPHYQREGKKSFPESLQRGVLKEFGVSIQARTKLGIVQHTFSHFRMSMHLFSCRLEGHGGRTDPKSTKKWIFPSQMERYPFSTADRKVIRILLQEES